ncbi:MAG: Ig-like domain-containing protein [Planctomycetota bacterium]
MPRAVQLIPAHVSSARAPKVGAPRLGAPRLGGAGLGGAGRAAARALGLLVAIGLPLAAQVGPGIGNLTYGEAELFQPVGVLHSANGHGSALAVSGYLMLVDKGDSSVEPIAIEFWDLSNPRNPRLAHRLADARTANILETHSFAVSTSYGGMHVALQARRGVQIWDVSDPAAPVFESELSLPNIQGVYGSIWWVFWQAPYLYVAGSSAGLYIARVDDVRNPVYLRTVPPSALGGLAPSQVFACGNLLILRQSKEFGFVTLDAEDPEQPTFVQSIPGERGYSSVFAAGKFLTSGGDGGPVQMFVHDVTHNGQMSLVGSVGSGFSNGAYGSYQDGFFHTGMSNVYAKIDIAGMTVVGTATTGIANRDEDFCQVLGNLAFVGDDHGVGSGLYVHNRQPDRTGPDVHWVHPAAGATDVGVSSRIGVSMSDNVDFASLGPATFTVRPVGGGAIVPGHYSGQMGLCNFAPSAPLAPGTTYEVTVQGVQDVMGNSGALFRSTFTTRAVPSGGATVQRLAAASGKAYALGTLQSGAPIYIDRTYQYGAVPARLAGSPHVMTANDDKFGLGASYVTFDLSQSAAVNVLYDERA